MSHSVSVPACVVMIESVDVGTITAWPGYYLLAVIYLHACV